jgi:hypothetical protein
MDTPIGETSRRCPEQAHQHLGGAGTWGTQARPSGTLEQAAELGDAKQPRRRAGRRAGVNAPRLRLRLGGAISTEPGGDRKIAVSDTIVLLTS